MGLPKSWNALCTFLLILICVKESCAQFQDPPIEALPNPPDGIIVEPVTGSNPRIVITENVPQPPDALNPVVPALRIAKILVTDPANAQVIISSLTPELPMETLKLEQDVTSNEWFICLSQGINYDYQGTKTILLTLTENQVSKTIVLQLVDVNDNPVQITGNEPALETNYPEKEIHSGPITKVLWSDVDEVDNVPGAVRFALEHTYGGDGFFRIDDTGRIFQEKEMDYQVFPTHRLRVTVYDSGDLNSDSILLTIDVRDKPDLDPVWNVLPPMINIGEYDETEIGQNVTQVIASDGDTGVNWDIIYELVENGHDEIPTPFFGINPTTGVITKLAKIDAEELYYMTGELSFELEVTAREVVRPGDTGTPGSITGSITVNMRDINDNPPEVCTDVNHPWNIPCSPPTKYAFDLIEESIGSLPLELPFVVRDLDATLPNSKYTIRFADGTPTAISNAFDIQPSRESSGVTEYTLSVKNSKELDYERADGFWLNPPTQFKITVLETGTSITVDVTFEVSLQDSNDNSPVFQNEAGQPVTEYRFLVCENLVTGYVLKELTADPGNSKQCPGEGTNPIRILAKDNDGSVDFSTVRYKWSSASSPPLTLDPISGEMTVKTDPNFDFERFDQEVFIVEAADNPSNTSNQRTSSIAVIFEVLDKNDRAPDLRIIPSRFDMDEGTPVGEVNTVKITAEDVDVSAALELKIENVRLLYNNETLQRADCDGTEWFTLDPGTPVARPDGKGQTLEAKLLVKESPDREKAGCGVVDRVDLTIVATDTNQGVDGSVSQTLTIVIKDINDTPPKWEGTGPLYVSVLETDAFEDGGDTATPLEREIMTLRASDQDTLTTFSFTIAPRNCPSPALCQEMLELVELDDGNSNGGNTNGRVILRRRLGKLIDREYQDFYGGDTDKLEYTITVSDSVHSIPIDVEIAVEDINDNAPEWTKDFNNPPLTVNEGVASEEVVIKFEATDADKKPGKFGTVNYFFHPDSIEGGIEGFFKIDKDTGVMSAIPGAYNWTLAKSHSFIVRAIDNYRPGVPTQSNSIDTNIVVTVVDYNNHQPEFITIPGETIISIRETEVEMNKPLPGAFQIRDKDDPSQDENGVFDVTIVKIVRENDDSDIDTGLFRIGSFKDVEDNKKEVEIIPTKDFTGLWGRYLVTFQAQDKGTPALGPVEQSYRIDIISVNLNTPEFVYPAKDNSSKILISTELNTIINRPVVDFDADLVDPILATDPDDEDNGNGRISYRIEPTDDTTDGSDYFSVEQQGNDWRLMLKASLEDSSDVPFYTILIVAEDNPNAPEEDSRSSVSTLIVYLTVGRNRQPSFNDTTPESLTIPENEASFSVAMREAFDPDTGLIDEYPELGDVIGDQSILYTIIDGSVEEYEELFEIVKGTGSEVPFLKTKKALDREDIDQYELTVRVVNPDVTSIPADPRGTLTIIVNVEDRKDTPPQFAQAGIISGGFSVNNDQGSTVAAVVVNDLDLDDKITFTMSERVNVSHPSLPTIPFDLFQNATNTAHIRLLFAPQPSMNGYYTFELTATDLGNMSTTIQCKMYIIKSKNEIDFKFFNRRDEIEGKRVRLTEILTDSFGYRCNIDRVNDDPSNVNTTILRTHFVDLVNNEPVDAFYISSQQYDPVRYSRLLSYLAAEGLVLNAGIGNQNQADEDNKDKLTIYLLVGGVGVLAVGLLVLSTTCFFNNRSLQRRVRSLTATTFGSQNSGLNRVGATMELPNTNEFAIEGSNPMWSTNPADREKNVPAFDAESIGSGGSVLIGVEDDDDFKNYRGTTNPDYDATGLEDSDAEYTKDFYESSTPKYQESASTPTKNQLYESDDSDSTGNSSPALTMPASSRRNPLLDM